tara:strand:- start:559 stop:792 length:234 start_codon:yes stop_codon:yes gene_type:complete
MSDMQIECNGSQCDYAWDDIAEARNDINDKIDLLAELILVTMFGRDKVYKPSKNDKRVRQREHLTRLVKEFDLELLQ